jgi:hypothetical protein
MSFLLIKTSRLVEVTLTVLSALFISASVCTGTGLGLSADIVTNAAPPQGAFPLVTAKHLAPIYYDSADYPGVIRAIGDLQADIERVTARKPKAFTTLPSDAEIVIAGTVGKNAAIDKLIASGKLDAKDLTGKWESFVITAIANPMPGVKKALVIIGSDKRGTIYGIYELSEQLGVSPWYWWADVPVKRHDEAYVIPGRFASGEPVVRYRGIFLNDERPCLTEWTKEKFGGMNHEFYTRVFELMLRMRANYLWPAMWDNAFNTDDPENPRLADEYGIVMGTSHHEPMIRSHNEWTSASGNYGNGQWDYATNSEALKRFFREGIQHNGKYENIITIGMRGDGDVGMVTTGSMQSDIKQLEQIMADQRRIIGEEMHTDPTKVPQIWALFSEVQHIYESGLRLPDDVTLLWADDNTGNLRRLPTDKERQRSGGSGIYYHIDMHGGPFAYQWINTNPFPKIQEQFYLANQYGANRIWIVNVGDLKPLELPIEFIMRMAWNPDAMTKDKVGEYTRRWAEREFGPEHADEIADIVSTFTKYNGWRKPELISPDTFSQINFGEAERADAEWRDVAARAEALYNVLPKAQRDAYYQLVLHPAKACAIVAEMNIAAGRNHLYGRQGRASANAEAGLVRELFRQDQQMTDYYNHVLADGKWNHLMDQTHLGEFTWEPPFANSMPYITEVLPPDNDDYAVSIDGDVFAWPDHYGDATLQVVDSFNPRRSYVEVFAKGTQPIEFKISAEQPWIKLSEDSVPRHDRRFWVDIDWSKAPEGASKGSISVTGKRGTVMVNVPVRKATAEQLAGARGCFASLDGPIAFAPTGATKRTEVNGVRWEEIPDYGRVKAALAIYPVTAASILPPNPAPTLEYPLYLPREGTYTVTLVLGPVVNFVPNRGMRIAAAFDDQVLQVADIFADHGQNGADRMAFFRSMMMYTFDNARYLRISCKAASAGKHVLKLAMVDPGIVIQKIIVSDRALPESYFGPLECQPVK